MSEGNKPNTHGGVGGLLVYIVSSPDLCIVSLSLCSCLKCIWSGFTSNKTLWTSVGTLYASCCILVNKYFIWYSILGLPCQALNQMSLLLTYIKLVTHNDCPHLAGSLVNHELGVAREGFNYLACVLIFGKHF